MKESNVKEHGGEKGKNLLGKGEVQGDLGIGIPDGDYTIEVESLLEMGPLDTSPQVNQNVHNNEGISDNGVIFRLNGVTKRDHRTLFSRQSGSWGTGILPPLWRKLSAVVDPIKRNRFPKNKPPEASLPGDTIRIAIHSSSQ